MVEGPDEFAPVVDATEGLLARDHSLLREWPYWPDDLEWAVEGSAAW